MISPLLQREILEQLDRLDDEQRRAVLAYARALARADLPASPGRSLLLFAGTIPADELAAMSRAIEDDCERVDCDEW